MRHKCLASVESFPSVHQSLLLSRTIDHRSPMAPRSVTFGDSPFTSSSSSPSSNNNNQQHRQQRFSFMNSLRVSTSTSNTAGMSPSSPSSPLYETATESPTSGGRLIDRLAFVLVDTTNNHGHHSPSSSCSRLGPIWWPAWIFESASEMFHELSLTTQHRAALMQEFFEVGRQHPAQAQQHVAYLLGPSSIIPACRRTIYASPTRDFWTISDEVVTNCSEYPGWCDACLAAPELSNCNLEELATTSPTHSNTSILSPSHRTSTSPLRGGGGGVGRSFSYVSPSSSPILSLIHI